MMKASAPVFLVLLSIFLSTVISCQAVSQCSGTPGIYGVPRLAMDKASIGGTMCLDIYNARKNAFYIIVGTAGGSPTPTPLGTICLNMALPIYFNAAYLDANGEATEKISIPFLSTFIGFPVNVQAAVMDSVNTTGYALTNAVAQKITPPYGYLSGGNTVTRIDMRDGSVLDSVNVGGGNLNGVTTDKSGRYVLASSSNAHAYLIDYGVTPPAINSLQLTTKNPFIYGATVTRDGRYWYISCYGYPKGSPGTTWVIDADPLNPGFFTLLGTVTGHPTGHNEIQDTEASPDMPFACCAVFGLGSGNAQLSKIDASPHSPGLNTYVGSVQFTSGWCTDVGIQPGTGYAFVSLFSLSFKAQVGVVDTSTMTAIDLDPNTWGIQHLGGQVSVPRTNIGNNPHGVSADRNFLYVVDSISQTSPKVYKAYQVDINPSSPTRWNVMQNYTMPIVQQPTDCALSPEGTKLLVSYNSSPHATLFDTVTGAVVKHWAPGFTPRGLYSR